MQYNQRHIRKKWTPLVGLCLWALLMVTTLPATAEVVLRFDPPMMFIEQGVITTLSIWLDDAIDIRTFEVRISYPPDLAESISGMPGQLFTDSGFMIWEGFEDDEPGLWHGFAIVMGGADWLTGPGELFRWSFLGLSSESFLIEVLEVALYAPDASLIPDVTLEQLMVIRTENQSWGNVKALYR